VEGAAHARIAAIETMAYALGRPAAAERGVR
jgi:hypothetical protein